MLFFKDTVTSRKNPLVSECVALHDKKGRDEFGCFLVEGIKLFTEAARAGIAMDTVFVRADKFGEYAGIVSSLLSDKKYSDTRIVTVSAGCFEKMSTEKAPQGILARAKYLDFSSDGVIIYNEDTFFENADRMVMLYSLRDPGNLGTVIRSAAAFGFDRILMSSDCADIYNPKTVRAAMGALFRLRFTVADDAERLIGVIRKNGRRVFAAELSDRAVSVGNSGLRRSDVIIIGNEGHGIPAAISSMCSGSIFIPISENTESLNAAAAAAVLMWEQSKAEI